MVDEEKIKEWIQKCIKDLGLICNPYDEDPIKKSLHSALKECEVQCSCKCKGTIEALNMVMEFIENQKK